MAKKGLSGPKACLPKPWRRQGLSTRRVRKQFYYRKAERSIFLCYILVFALNLFLFPASLRADGFTKGGILFARGDYTGAEIALGDYLQSNPGNKKAKNLYQRITLKLAKEALDMGDDDSAREYAEKAYRINPSDPQARDLYLATKKLDKVKVDKTDIARKKQSVKKMDFSKFSDTQPRERIVERIKYETKVEYRTREIIQQVAEIPEWIWLSIVFNLALLLGGYLLYTYKRKSRRDIYENYLRSKLMLSNALKYNPENVKHQLGEQKAAELFKLLSVENMPEDMSIKFVEANRSFTDINPMPRLQADSVELAEKFLTDKKELINFVKPYLYHKNNRAQGNAVVVMFKHKPSLAIKALKSMASSEDRWKKVSAVWVCEQLDSPEATKILAKLAVDGDVGVALAADKAVREQVKKEAEDAEKALSEVK